MSDKLRAGFHQAICDNLDDDTDRFVYADWLDDQGETARAEFIRVQCALAGSDPSEPQWIDLRLREFALLNEHRKTWLNEIPRRLRSRSPSFSRGFVSTIECTVAQYGQYQNDLCKRTVIDEVKLRSREPPDVPPQGPHLARMRRWSGQVNSPTLASWSAALPGLVHVSGFNESTLVEHLDAMNLPALRELCLVVNRAQMARSWTLPPLDLLWLRYRDGEGEMVNLEQVLANPGVASVQRLLIPEHLGGQSIEQLVAAESLCNLRELCIGVSSRGDNDALRTLFQASHWPHLHSLHLNHANDETLDILADSPLAGQIRSLSLWPTQPHSEGLTGKGMRNLIQRGTMTQLVRLGLSTVERIDAMVKVIASSPGLPNLAYLSLYQVETPEDGLKALSQSPHVPALRAVSMPRGMEGLPWPVLPAEWWWSHV